MQAAAPEMETIRADSRELTLVDAIQILFRRWKFIAWFTLGTTILAAVIALILRDEFTASAIILPPTQEASAGSSLLAQVGGAAGMMLGSSLGLKSQGDLIQSLLKTETVENEIINQFHLQQRYHQKKLSGARGVLEHRTKIVLGTKDGLITIHVTDRDPNLAAAMANAYIDAYRKLSERLAISEASQRRMFYEQQLLEAKENLARADVALKNVEQSTGVLQVESQTRALIESAAMLRAQVAAKEVQLQGLRSFATDTNPEYMRLKDELNALQEQLARVGASDEDPALIIPKGKETAATLDYVRKLRDVKYYEAVSELIARQYEIAKQDEARQGVGVQVVERATPPDSKSAPMRKVIVLLAFLMGLFIASGWCLISARVPESLRDSLPFRKKNSEWLSRDAASVNHEVAANHESSSRELHASSLK